MYTSTEIDSLFRHEYAKIIAVISRLFGLENIETAEDIVQETFLLATETWKAKGMPNNPTAWLYGAAKNKTKEYLRRNALYNKKIKPVLTQEHETYYTTDEQLEMAFTKNEIQDSQLRMMFAICHPSIPQEAQVALALRVLCGFGIEEIAEAFLSSKETINKRLYRAKEKLREEKVTLTYLGNNQMNLRLETVTHTLYLLFNEGYYSSTNNKTIQKNLCQEAMRLCLLLCMHTNTQHQDVYALMALMCFHSSRFEARQNSEGDLLLYDEQDTALWNNELVAQGELYMNSAAKGNEVSRYHIEAAIAYWHTRADGGKEKWENILSLYTALHQIVNTAPVLLNRIYALSKVTGNKAALDELLKLPITGNHLYFALLGELYKTQNVQKAREMFLVALELAKTENDKKTLAKKINLLAS